MLRKKIIIYIFLILFFMGFAGFYSIPSIFLPVPSPPDSSVLYLDQSWIKGDGSVEGEKLQDALDYARDHSLSKVIFPKDTVIITTSKIDIYSGLNVVGNGSTIRLKEDSGYPRDTQIMNLRENASCRGLKFDGQWHSNSFVNGIRLYSGSVFDGNEVFNIGAYSIYIYDAKNVTITNNVIHDGRQYGIATGGGSVEGNSHNITVSDNTIYNMQEVGIKIRGTYDSTITNNTVTIPEITGKSSSGIRLYSYDNRNENIRITNNTVLGNLGLGEGYSEGIASDDSKNYQISITNNRVSRCDTGIVLRFNDGIITGNTIANCRNDCIDDNGKNNTINSNILTRCNIGDIGSAISE